MGRRSEGEVGVCIILCIFLDGMAFDTCADSRGSSAFLLWSKHTICRYESVMRRAGE